MWISFCLTAMIFTNTINWKAWERWSGKKYSDSALSKMLHWSQIPWNALLVASTKLLLSRYNIHKGVLVIDDSDHQRSKKTTNIAHVHRIKDKKNDGYFRGENLVFLLQIGKLYSQLVGHVDNFKNYSKKFLEKISARSSPFLVSSFFAL